MKRLVCLVVLVPLLVITASAHAAVCRVVPGGDPANDGSAWDAAHAMSLQGALTNVACDEIWVLHGRYVPTTDGDRSKSFVIRPGVKVYGGFEGDENYVTQRQWQRKTILSGDLGNNDTDKYPYGDAVPDDGSNAENSYHVVYIDGDAGGPVTGSTVLDTLVITGGNADGGDPHDDGAGMRCDGVGGQCNPTLVNLLFVANHAADSGGALLNDGIFGEASPTLTDVTFLNNVAGEEGGAIYNDGNASGLSSPVLTNVTFSGNQALVGGAVSNWAANGIASPVLRHVTFRDNFASTGGAMASDDFGTGTSTPQLEHVIMWDTAAEDEVYNFNGAMPTFSHSIIFGSGGSAAWHTPFGTDLGGNLDVDPLLGPLAYNGGFTPTMLPGFGSPAINAGTATCVTASDQRRATRPVEGACDIGAVEARFAPCKVDASAGGAPGDGASWATAFVNPQWALIDATCNEVWVADGVYPPISVPGPYPYNMFLLRPRVAMYGGFAGTETTREQRDPKANLSILTGDLDGNDINTDGNGIAESVTDIQGDNALHVVVFTGAQPVRADESSVLDGFVITAGSADGTDPNAHELTGGGMLGLAEGGACNPTLNQLVFVGNQAVGTQSKGGALYSECNLTLSNSIFHHNTAEYGGALALQGASPVVRGSTFRSNTAHNGGAMYLLDASPTINNVSFDGNSSTNSGGAMYNDVSGTPSAATEPWLTHVTFSNNHAGGRGGAMLNTGVAFIATYTQPKLQNVILWGNSAAYDGQQICNRDVGSVLIDYSIVEGGDAGIDDNYSVPGTPFADGIGNLDADPLLGALQDNGGFTWTRQPGSASPAIDAADPSTCLLDDQTGTARPQGAGCDIGSVEVPVVRADCLCHVDASATGTPHDGSSWAQAFTNLHKPLLDMSCEEIWVAEGVYTPVVPAAPNAVTVAERDTSFRMARNVSIYGGFAGGETDRNQRDPEARPTILSGDIDGNDGNADGNNVAETWTDVVGSNSYHVLVVDGTTARGPVTNASRISGFIITAGKADGDGGNDDNRGGGAVCMGVGSGHGCGLRFWRVLFSGNQAAMGGALWVVGGDGGDASPSLTDVTFANNHAVYGAGAVGFDGDNGGASPALTRTTFTGNQAGANGGAIYLRGSTDRSWTLYITNSTFVGNSAAQFGGAIYASSPGETYFQVQSTTFSGNSAGSYGGALAAYGDVTPLLMQVIDWGNSSPAHFAGSGAYFLIDESVLEGGCPPSDATCTTVLTGDPLLGPLQDNGGYTPTKEPQVGSSAIDVIDCTVVSVLDQRGAPRPDPTSTGPLRCDIGAVEADKVSDLIFANGFEN